MKIIDISENNGTIDFNKIKQQNVQGIIIRIGWIGNKENHTLDKKFYQYVKGCKNYGLPYGVYIYSYCKSMSAIRSGSMWLLNKLNTIDYKPTYPIFLDMEDVSIIECGKENLTNQCTTFCNYIENNSGYKAGIYANLHWFTTYLDVNKLIYNKIWLAQYTTANNHSAKFKVDLWQYTSKGKLDGINGYVDLNKCLSCNKDNSEKKKENMK